MRSDVPEAQTQGLAMRALDVLGPDRLFAWRLAARLIGPDCPRAKGLPDETRRDLEELAAVRRRPACRRRLIIGPADYPPSQGAP